MRGACEGARGAADLEDLGEEEGAGATAQVGREQRDEQLAARRLLEHHALGLQNEVEIRSRSGRDQMRSGEIG